MTCEEFQDLMLDRQQSAELSEHLARCTACAAAAREMKSLDDLMKPLGELRAPDALQDRLEETASSKRVLIPSETRGSRFWRGVVMAAAAFFLGLVLWQIFSSPAPQQGPTEKGPATVLPQEQEKDLAVNGLRLTLKLPKEKFAFREIVDVEATFENVSGKEVTFHIPLRSVHFPYLSVSGKSGEYVPEPFMGGVSLQNGKIEGSLVTLKAGEKKSYRLLVGRWNSASVLPAGTYTAKVGYDKTDDTVPVTGETKKSIEGLWVGKVESRALTFTVGEPVDLVGRLVEATEAGVVKLELTNFLKRDVDLKCRAVATFHSKYHGVDGKALIDLDKGANLDDGKTFPLRLKQGETKTWTLDLLAINWTLDKQPRAKSPVGLADFGGDQGVWIAIRMECEGDPEAEQVGLLLDQYMSIRIPAQDISDRLTLRLSAEKPRTAPGEPIVLKLSLSAAKEACLINQRFAFPADWCVEITDSQGERTVLRWKSRSDHPPALTKEHFKILRPKEETSTSVDVNTYLELHPGRYKLRATYRNVESGKRLGVETPALLGRVSSNEVDIEVTEK